MLLLERHHQLSRLEAALQQTVTGRGAVVLIGGEAGIGKTTLIERFAEAHAGEVRVLWGACDALFTPRPFGPFHDIAGQGLAALDELLRDSNRSTSFARVLATLSERPTVIAVEDVHWADEASLDLLMYLGRRVARASLLMIVTYRTDELHPHHPLRNVLGVLASSATTQRLELAPLSVAAVQTLGADQGVSAIALHTATGGNPFFVTEALANTGAGVPTTIRDVVLARASRLSPSGLAVLEAAAILGPRIEPTLLAAMAAAEAPYIDECLELGLLQAQAGALTFRHELARQAVLDSLSPHRRLVLHRLALTTLSAPPHAALDAARLAHHAAAADDHEAILIYAPAAGHAAARAGAQREASTLFALALRYAQDLPADERARLYEAHADACNHSDDRVGSLDSRRSALAIWRALSQPLRVGECLAHCAIQLNGLGRSADAERDCQNAIDLLSLHPPGRELALAYRVQAGLKMLTQEYRSAILLGEKAIALAEAAQAPAIVFAAHNTIGSAWLTLDYERGRQYLEGNLRTTHAAGFETLAALAYTNLSSASSELFRFAEAERYFREGSGYAAERGLVRFRLYMLAWHAHTLLQTGRWSECERAARDVIDQPSVSATSRITALAALGQLNARRGAGEVTASLDEALALSRDLRSLHRLGLVRVARAEAAWLAGDLERTRAETGALIASALEAQHPWFAGELLYWLHQCGEAVDVPAWVARPHALHLSGDWRGAAEEWRRLGCPYARARALADGDFEAQTVALEVFEQLGAVPAAERLRARIRDSGGTVPRGPRASTRSNAFGLTTRQVEILGLIAQGLTNTEIAGRLHLSAKTVDHHVSAVLGKLNVSSRAEAADLARRAGILPD